MCVSMDSNEGETRAMGGRDASWFEEEEEEEVGLVSVDRSGPKVLVWPWGGASVC